MRLAFAAAASIALLLSVGTISPLQAQAQQAKPAYPVVPRSLPDAEEIALAVSAAPDEVSSRADVYVLRGSEWVKARPGTNGCACLVARDLHEGSLYPICYDQEAARTTMYREMMEVSLRAKGKSEAEIERAVDAAYASGELKMPAKSSMAYMMSPRQVLFSSPKPEGVHVGAWSPHLMLMLPGVTTEQMGLAAKSKVDIIQLNDVRPGHTEHTELVVKVPTWADGRSASTPVGVR